MEENSLLLNEFTNKVHIKKFLSFTIAPLIGIPLCIYFALVYDYQVYILSVDKKPIHLTHLFLFDK